MYNANSASGISANSPIYGTFITRDTAYDESPCGDVNLRQYTPTEATMLIGWLLSENKWLDAGELVSMIGRDIKWINQKIRSSARAMPIFYDSRTRMWCNISKLTEHDMDMLERTYSGSIFMSGSALACVG